MNLPISAAVKTQTVKENEAYIVNPYPGKDFLTQQEALDLVSKVAGMLSLDMRRQKRVYGGTR
jgi:hypothetical protein